MTAGRRFRFRLPVLDAVPACTLGTKQTSLLTLAAR